MSFLTNCASLCGFGVIGKICPECFIIVIIIIIHHIKGTNLLVAICYMQAVLFDAMHIHLIYTAEVFPENTEAFKPASSDAKTCSGDKLARD